MTPNHKKIRPVCGINGFGRFGLHLLNAYLSENKAANIEICFINDEVIGVDRAYEIISKDGFVKIPEKFSVKKDGNYLVFDDQIRILFTKQKATEVEWLGTPDIFLECSGAYRDKAQVAPFLKGNTNKVLISATSYDVDQTLLFGFNHDNYDDSAEVISYGSCTVNAYVPFAQEVDRQFGIRSSSTNIIHNVPQYQIDSGKATSLTRRFCTLQAMGPKLLPFINDNNFKVNYTLVPYAGVSIFDFAFQLNKQYSGSSFVSDLLSNSGNPLLSQLYSTVKEDNGPDEHKLTRSSAVFVEDSCSTVGDTVHLFSYFDNENSVNRYMDLLQFIASKI